MSRRIGCVASGLKELGVDHEDSVAMFLRNDLTFMVVAQAAAMIGALPVPLNWHSSSDEVRFMLEDSEAKVLIGHSDLMRRLSSEALPAGIKSLWIEPGEALRDAFGLAEEDTRIPESETAFATWLEGFSALIPEKKQLPRTVIYTSGTTGRPKGVVRNERTAEQIQALRQHLRQTYGFVGDESEGPVRTSVVAPHYHSSPSSHATAAFDTGADIFVMPRFDPEGLLALIERERITHLNLVPIMFSRLLSLPAEVRKKYDLSSLRYVVHAAAPCPETIKREMIDWWGPIIHETYGSTEMGTVTLCNSEDALAHPGTVGRPVSGATVRIVDGTGAELPPGEVGAIIGRAPGITDFVYRNQEDETKDCFMNGLIVSGDVGYLNEEGYLFITDRNKDMIISGGVNIYPAEIEAALHAFDEIDDCAVFGIPNKEYGESVCAYVQLRPGQSLTSEEVIARLRERIAGFKVPRRVEFAEALPREDTGKVRKRLLRDPYWENSSRRI